MPPTTLEADDDIVQPTSPTFKIFTGTLKAYEKQDDTRKYLRCTASSTADDLHGDRMTEECVMGMAPQAKAKGMTIFLNHSYKWPEDVFGKTVDATIVSRASDADGKAIYDLDLEIMLNEANDRAIETYAAIKDQGMKAGVSIGAMIEDWDYIDEEAGFWGGLEIKQVDLLEASVVGIPANQRSWVVNALKALGAPKVIINKALGKDDGTEDPRAALIAGRAAVVAAAKADAAVLEPPTETKDRYFLNGVDVTEQLDLHRSLLPATPNEDGSFTLEAPVFKSVTVRDADGNEVIDEAEAAPEGETPVEASAADELDPADDEKKTSSTEAAEALASMKAAGADGPLAEIVLGFLEGATEEVASLRKTVEDLTKERDEAVVAVKEAAEIVETLARTPIGRKAQFTGPVTSFRQKFGGFYDEGFLKVLDAGDTTDE